MKIILRDIFQQFFPKYLTSYLSLSKEQKQSIIENITTCHQQKQQKQKSHPQQIPEYLAARRSFTNQKDKKTFGQIQQGENNQEGQMVIKRNQKHKNIQNSKIRDQDLHQRLSQITTEKLSLQISHFIKNHRFLLSQLVIDKVYSHFLCFLSHLIAQSQSQQSNKSRLSIAPLSLQSVTQNLYKLSLYLNKQTNKQIFTVYEYILLSNPRVGISYETLAKKIKTDIINVSHYCCKLKKMRFIDWEHKKQGIVVFPKIMQNNKLNNPKDNELTPLTLQSQDFGHSFSYDNSFLYKELSLNQNILVNLCSVNSLQQGGLTNEEIKFKIMKHAQNKMVRRTVEGMKNIERAAERQGKVFEFKYKRQTQLIIKEMDKKKTDNIVELTEKCRSFLSRNFTIIQGDKKIQNQELLQHIVNTKLTDYVSSIGIRQSKRQCTPLKLNRYINILNFLQFEGPCTELELRRHIIEIQKDLESYQGIIHKRSVVGILQGLKKIHLIEEIQGWIYPCWCEVTKRDKINLRKQQSYADDDQRPFYQLTKGNKKTKVDNQTRSKHKHFFIPQQKIRMITKRQHLNQIFVQLLSITFLKAAKRTLRKGFHRIMYAHRKKQSVQMFVSERNIFHLLQNSKVDHFISQQHPTTLQSFMLSVGDFVEIHGKKLEGFPEIEYEFVKYVRRNPSKHADCLRSKYGKQWKEKFQPLQQQGVIKLNENGYQTLEGFHDFLV